MTMFDCRFKEGKIVDLDGFSFENRNSKIENRFYNSRIFFFMINTSIAMPALPTSRFN